MLQLFQMKWADLSQKMPELAEAVDMLRAVLKRSKREDKTA